MTRLRTIREEIAGAVTAVLGIPCASDVEGDPQPDTAGIRPAPGDWLSAADGTFCDVDVTFQITLLASAVEFVAAQEQLEEWVVELFAELFKQPLPSGAQCPRAMTSGPPSSVAESSSLLAMVVTLAPFSTTLK